MNNAPIAIFVYNRPEHTERMVNSLRNNTGYDDAEITVYCDGPKNDNEWGNVKATRQVIRNLLPKANIIESNKNKGLANSVINGVSEQCDKHGRVIVIEDDLILSPVALDYFNKNLNHYAEIEKVMHISAYMFPVKQELPEAFFYREATCWGWATWKRAWVHFEHDANEILLKIKKSKSRYEFNIEHSMFFSSLLRKHSQGQIDSWAVRWYGSMFMLNGLSLHPGKSLVQNGGFDGTGVHCNKTDVFDVTLSNDIPDFPKDVIESRIAVKAMIEYRKQIHNYSSSSKFKYLLGKLLNRLYVY
jgi:glycosyl transferase family 2